MRNEIRKIVKEMVRQEIRDILAENKQSINEIVKTSLVPELRSAIRDSISHVLQDIPSGEHARPKRSSPISKDTEVLDAAFTSPSISPPREVEIPIQDEREFKKPNDSSGRYLYCVVEGIGERSLGRIGIEGNEVYTIPYESLSAVVHECPAEPYESEDEEIMKKWVKTHHKVVEWVCERAWTVLPVGFDTIIQGDRSASPEENMKNWLKQNYENLKRKIEKVRGKAEYGVQVFWDPRMIAKKIAKENPEIKEIQEDLRLKPKGLAYMYKQKIEKMIKTEMERKADQDVKLFLNKIEPYTDGLKVEKTKKAGNGKQMLMNLSCLLRKESSKKLADELEKIDTLEGFSVRYTGPWPPYSFV